MKTWALGLFLLASLGMARATSYSTSFTGTENPVSESGNWINGGTAGLAWTNVRTTPGMAFGTQNGAGSFDDSTAVLSGTWGANQTVTATVHTIAHTQSTFEEIELRLRTTIIANSITGYEINFAVGPGQNYTQIVRWNGALGSFTMLANQPTGGGVVNGDVISASVDATNTIRVFKNGVQVNSATDATFTAGRPGMGFFLQGALNSADYGLSSLSASDSAAPPPLPPSGCTGPFDVLNPPPVSCRPYPNAYYNQQLPNAGAGGPLTHLMPNSTAIVNTMFSTAPLTSPSAILSNGLGINDAQHRPMIYSQATDPVFKVTGCNPTFGPATNAINNQTFHAPSQAPFSQSDNDEEIVIWDQTTNNQFAFYHFNNVAQPGTLAAVAKLPICPGGGHAGTAADPCSYNPGNGYCSMQNRTTGSGIDGGSGSSTAGLSPFGNVTRITELDTIHHINHGLRGLTLCDSTNTTDTNELHGLYQSKTVFPANTSSGGPANSCSAAGVSPAFRPPNGTLLFLDYTNAQLDCFNPTKASCPGITKLPDWQFAMIEAVTFYGDTLEDTGPGNNLLLAGFESDIPFRFFDTRGYSGAINQANAWVNYMHTKCPVGLSPPAGVNCYESDRANGSIEWFMYPWLGISNVNGTGVVAHLHAADPCVAIGLQGLASFNGVAACASVAPPPANPLISGNTSFTFPTQNVGVTSNATLATTLTNAGTTNLTFTSLAFASAGAPNVDGVNFKFSSGCASGQVLTPGTSCPINLKFKPSVLGTLTDTLSVVSNATNTPFVINLSGVGGQPDATLSPGGGITFAAQAVATTSGPSQAILLSSGTGSMTVTAGGISVTGPFSISSTTCPVSPAVMVSGQSCQINVVFSPTVAGAASGTLSVADNAVSGSPQTIALSGTGQGPPTTGNGIIINAPVLMNGGIVINPQ